MDLNTFKQQIKNAINNDTLLTPKHDPNNLSVTFPSYRSVLSHEASASLATFINSEDFTIHEYRNTNPTHTPYYMKIIPNSFLLSILSIRIWNYSKFSNCILIVR